MEFVDENGEAVAPGETGEIVCTSLFNKAMPFIRYSVGDIGKASEENSCPCGRTLPFMKIIEGRKDAIAFLPDGRAISSFAFIAGIYNLSFYNEIEKFRVIQKKLNLFKFLIVMKNDRIKEEDAKIEVGNYFRKMLNLENTNVDFEVEFVNDISLDRSGKYKIFISEIEKESCL
jgi:phenylacetate-CoA ligase